MGNEQSQVHRGKWRISAGGQTEDGMANESWKEPKRSLAQEAGCAVFFASVALSRIIYIFELRALHCQAGTLPLEHNPALLALLIFQIGSRVYAQL
jgi:hypothetical protein